MRLFNKLKFKSKELLHKLTKPQLVAHLNISIDGKLVEQKFCESLTYNFLQWIYVMWSNADAGWADSAYFGKLNVNRTNNTVSSANKAYAMNAPAGQNYGIGVGSGSSTVAPLDYNWETVISSGSGAGQLLYNAMQGSQGCQISGNETSFRMLRTFYNSSGLPVTVNEIGVSMKYSTEYILIIHDNISSVNVLDAQTLAVEIVFTITT